MSTRVQKGGTVFRPVTKARPRVAESISKNPLVTSRGDPASQPAPEAHKTQILMPLEDEPVIVSTHSVAVPLLSLSAGTGDARSTVAVTHGVPIIVSSRAPPLAQTDGSQPIRTVDKTAGPAGPSHSLAIEPFSSLQSKRRSRSDSLAGSPPRKSSKARRNETPVFDANAGPGENLDPTSVTMAALCEDTGQGRISSKAAQIVDNHLAWKKSNREKRTRMRTLMEAKKYSKNVDGDTAPTRHAKTGSEQAIVAVEGPPLTAQSVSASSSTAEDTSGQGFDYTQNVSTSRYNVQVRIGPNGETIVDEESLFVDRNAEEDTTEYIHVEESDVTKFVNSATYSKRFRGSRWSAEETELFFDALSQFGENYELISYVLPGRDRKACKNKFKIEDKKNPQRINYCLSHRKPYDIQTLSRMTGKDFSGPTPEIRAPAAISLAGSHQNAITDQPPDQGSSSTIAKHVEEVIGDISYFDPE